MWYHIEGSVFLNSVNMRSMLEERYPSEYCATGSPIHKPDPNRNSSSGVISFAPPKVKIHCF